jgi:hypothetical protein
MTLRASLLLAKTTTSNCWCLIVGMASGSILRAVRWARVLPVLAVGITSVLMILAAKQNEEIWATYARHSDTPQEFQAPARLFAQILNGPGFFFTVWRGGFEAFGLYFSDVGRLLGVVLFWCWVGWALDRRLRGTCAPFIRSRLVRGSLYATLLGLSCMFAGLILEDLHSRMLFPAGHVWRFVVAVGLRYSAWNFYVFLLWTFAFVLYFGRKLLVAITSPTLPKSGSTPLNQT